jgi:hypothetical protein
VAESDQAATEAEIADLLVSGERSGVQGDGLCWSERQLSAHIEISVRRPANESEPSIYQGKMPGFKGR